MSQVATNGLTDAAHLDGWNQSLAKLSASERVRSALEHLPGAHVVTSSFGAHAAVSLHLLTRELPDMPVILLDTGYLPADTYLFVDRLADLLHLNLHIYSSRRSPAWQEASDGERWKLGVGSVGAYHRENKLEPLERAFTDLAVGTWFTGAHRDGANTRFAKPFVSYTGRYFRVSPIADWSDRDVSAYLQAHALPAP